jgi:hypothetical protein
LQWSRGQASSRFNSNRFNRPEGRERGRACPCPVVPSRKMVICIYWIIIIKAGALGSVGLQSRGGGWEAEEAGGRGAYCTRTPLLLLRHPSALWVPWVPYLAVLWAFEGPGFGFVTKSKPNNPRLRLLRAGHCRDASMSAQSASVGIPVAKCCLHISESEPHTQLPGPAAGATAARQPRVHQVHAAAPRRATA